MNPSRINLMHLRLFSPIVLALFLAGCTTPEVPFVADKGPRPAPVYCFDSVGHTPGSKPFIMGGTCCCTPTQALMDKYHADAQLQDMQLAGLLALYEERSVKLLSDTHKGCNNLCQWGPHIVKGGKCMVPPTPATFNFEEVRYGLRHMNAPPKKK